MIDFGKILARWKLRRVLNDVIIAKDYLKNNKYDTADLLLLDSRAN